ncbi:S-adenosylmethionine:tRNA ribosyltransferase-isomerase [Pseudalkalibacillus caeni]|uniref:S-adenosylmethionine:tRNA ribosyltransferase-isomerase n=2 Tax=Exobacillus caeni TaxID=2574798 RepID=A0A5R9F557_9BACL|nr:S-adenosylmethionine:tRNA ribosyltransferase-isomerase [Pseudalkalibacillus caeni]
MLAPTIKFEVPDILNAAVPPERRGVRRDHVRMLILGRKSGVTQHDRFNRLEDYLKKGDLLVLNASRTVPAVLYASLNREGNRNSDETEVRLARKLDDSTWECLIVAEDLTEGDLLAFSTTLFGTVSKVNANSPFATVSFSLSGPLLFDQIYELGEPVRYEYIKNDWPLDYYQTVYGNIPGSVEMASAGRAFTWEILFKLQKKGVKIAFIHLHTGLTYLLDDKWHQSPEQNEEAYHISEEAARMINETKTAGGRVIAVGTTVVRALETAVDPSGQLEKSSGWTNLYIHPEYDLKIADGLITGFHEPEASHLDMLSAFIDPGYLHNAYQEAIERKYLWHEFGDINLIL